MKEDIELANFVKDRLEEGIASEPRCLAEIERVATAESFALLPKRRSRRRFWGSSLVAASFAAVCSVTVLTMGRERPAPESTVAGVIDLLRASDGDTTELEAGSVAEMLLAWQDAPYEAAVSGLVSDYAN